MSGANTVEILSNGLALVNMLATLYGQAAPVIALLQTTKKEGREPTDEEVAALFASDDAMAALFQRHIDEAKAAEAASGGQDQPAG